ncbi:hypothetical protein [uncultured Alistipes sp.]|uniref:hypothetical protein n=1 Tax=uncultured Alistipes sp. TaxID=538949 RepID=UPI002803AD75|nr:hypothetical protein [uncultured Alistipes sp.]
MKNPFYKFLLMGALLLGVTSCSDDNTESSSTPSFAISVPTAENYEILVADKAKEGDEVSLVVTPADGMEVVSVFYNDSPARSSPRRPKPMPHNIPSSCPPAT